MRKLIRLAAIVAVPLLILAGAYDLTRISSDYAADGHPFVRMVSGPAGGTWYPLGAAITQVFRERESGILAANGPGGGIENIRDVEQRNAEIGFSMTDVVSQAYQGSGKFKHAHGHIRHFATLYTNILQVAVPRDSNIHSIADLGDRNISPGKAGWGGTEMTRAVLKTYGITFDSVKANGGTVHHVDYTDSVAMMKDGHIDGFFALSSVPQSSLMELNFDPGIRLLSIENEHIEGILKDNPGLVRVTIPKSAYEHMEQDVQTVGVPCVLIVHEDVPDDLVYGLAKAFWEGHNRILEVSPVWNTVTVENGLLAPAAPVHPGAKRFYDEAGVSVRN
jgi:hypothetical protein